jgi:hypothetical protein
VAGVELDDIVQQVQDAMWRPEYCRIQASLNKPEMKKQENSILENQTSTAMQTMRGGQE